MKKDQFKTLGICRRCTNEKAVNQSGLCRNCDETVDKEYAQLFTVKTME